MEDYYICFEVLCEFGMVEDFEFEVFFSRMGVEIFISDDLCVYYSFVKDYIYMLLIVMFYNVVGYYGILVYEVIYWIGSEKWFEWIKKFVNCEVYVFEELVVEIGVCFFGV